MFAFHLHALIDICKPKQLLESLCRNPLSCLVFLLPVSKLNSSQHFNNYHSGCMWMWVVSCLFPWRFGTFLLQEYFHSIFNLSCLHFRVVLKPLINSPVFIYSHNLHFWNWKVSSVRLLFWKKRFLECVDGFLGWWRNTQMFACSCRPVEGPCWTCDVRHSCNPQHLQQSFQLVKTKQNLRTSEEVERSLKQRKKKMKNKRCSKGIRTSHKKWMFIKRTEKALLICLPRFRSI